MRRVLRWAWDGAAAVSAVLFVAVVVLRVRSHRVADYLQWQWAEDRGGSRYSWDLVVSAGAGGLAECRTKKPKPPPVAIVRAN